MLAFSFSLFFCVFFLRWQGEFLDEGEEEKEEEYDENEEEDEDEEELEPPKSGRMQLGDELVDFQVYIYVYMYICAKCRKS